MEKADDCKSPCDLQLYASLHPPSAQGFLSCCWVFLDPQDSLPRQPHLLADLRCACPIGQHLQHQLKRLSIIAGLLASVLRSIHLSGLYTSPLSLFRCLSLCACAVAAMNAMRASLTASCIGSVVPPSKVILLITVLMTTPFRMKWRIVSVTS